MDADQLRDNDEQLQQLMKQNSELEQQLQRLNEENISLNVRLRDTQDEMCTLSQTHQEKMAEKEIELKWKVEQIRFLEKELNENVAGTISSLEEKIEGLNLRTCALRAELSEAQKEVDNVSIQNNDLKAELKNVGQQLTFKDEALKVLEAELTAAESSGKDKADFLQATVDDLTNKLEISESKLLMLLETSETKSESEEMYSSQQQQHVLEKRSLGPELEDSGLATSFDFGNISNEEDIATEIRAAHGFLPSPIFSPAPCVQRFDVATQSDEIKNELFSEIFFSTFQSVREFPTTWMGSWNVGEFPVVLLPNKFTLTIMLVCGLLFMVGGGNVTLRMNSCVGNPLYFAKCGYLRHDEPPII